MADFVERKPELGFMFPWLPWLSTLFGNPAFIIFLILILLVFGIGFLFI